MKLFLYVADVDGFEPDFTSLSSGELLYASNLVGKYKKTFMIRRGWIRQKIGEVMESSPEKIPIEVTPRGKLYIPGHPIYFNSSSDNRRMLLGISDIPIGVDIEKVCKRKNLTAIANQFYSLLEKQWLDRKMPDQKLASFYKIWCRREAYVKLSGKGLALGMGRGNLAGERAGWFRAVGRWFYDFTFDGGYTASICVPKTNFNEPLLFEE